MQIANLEINILYFMCNPLNGQAGDGAVDRARIFEEFSDIPSNAVGSAIHALTADGLVAENRKGSQLVITDSGISRLQSSIACRIHRFDRCRCERPLQRPMSRGLA